MDRSLLVAQLQLPHGQRCCVATVHLESLDRHSVRVQQMKEIARVFATLSPSPSPLILCPDFNFLLPQQLRPRALGHLPPPKPRARRNLSRFR